MHGSVQVTSILTLHTTAEIVEASCLKTPSESWDIKFFCCIDSDSRVKNYLYCVFYYLGCSQSLTVKELGGLSKPFLSFCSVKDCLGNMEAESFWNQ